MDALINILRTVVNAFRIPDLRKKLIFTLSLLCIYRIGFHITLPVVDQTKLAQYMAGQAGSALGKVADYLAIFTGGNLGQSTLFGLGIMPYISAAIIFQLLVTVVPALEKLQKEGETGRRKIQEYTRYATVGLCLVQGTFWVRYMMSSGLVYPAYEGSMFYALLCILALTTGTMFLMWLGEQIDEYGIGNGVSLIIMAGILARMPWAVISVLKQASFNVGAGEGSVGPSKLLFLAGAFVFVVGGAILITQGQRRIPIQQAKQTRGRRVYGGQRQYLPLRVNHGGVMPIIFATSLMLFPSVMMDWVYRAWPTTFTALLYEAFQFNAFTYNVCEIGLIFFFAYFWTTVQFQPKEMAEQLRDYGHFIPGLRPGKRTADYLERVMTRITYVGAAFLSVIAVVPNVVTVSMGIQYRVATFLGGTGLLIVVSVALDLVNRVEAALIMRHYSGFMGDTGRIKGAY